MLAVVGALIVVSGGGAGAYLLLGREGGAEAPPVAPAQIADDTFTAPPTAQTDGLHQVVGDVAAVGDTVVAVGSEYGGSVGRARFLVSTNGGNSWQIAPVETASGGPPDGSAPSTVVGTANGWLALGGTPSRRTVWTSTDGLAWTEMRPQSESFAPNDEVNAIAWTAEGYIAVGNQAADETEHDRATLWLSGDGTSWQRFGPDQVELPVEGGTVSNLRTVVAHGTVAVMVGEVIDEDGEITDSVWRSTDAARTWQPVDLPQPEDAGPDVRGLAANNLGFFALRQSGGQGIVLTSADGATWEQLGEVGSDDADIAEFIDLAAGGEGLAALATTDDDRSVVYRSSDGSDWEGPGDLGHNEYRAISSLTPAPGAAAVVAGTRVGSDQDFYLAVARTSGRATEIDLKAVTGAVHQERTVREIVRDGGRTVALGSANGEAAAWVSTEDTGWAPAQGEDLGGHGQQRLTDAAYGNGGWVAVGVDHTEPLVATSADASSWEVLEDAVFGQSDDTVVRTAGAAHGPEGYVIVGSEDPGDTPVRAAAWHSSELDGWEKSEDDNLDNDKTGSWRWMADVAAASMGYVAVGTIGSPDVAGQERPAVWMSSDGLGWDVHQPPLPEGATRGDFSRVAIKDSTIVAIGSAHSPDGVRVFAVVSTDRGNTWHSATLPGEPSPGDLESIAMAVTATSSGFAAVSTTGGPGSYDVALWTSADGESWHAVTPRGTGLSGAGAQRIHALTAVGQQLLGVGTSADTEGEHVTLWRTHLP